MEDLHRRDLDRHADRAAAAAATVEAIASRSLPRPFAAASRVRLELLRRGAEMLGRPLDEFDGFRVVVRDSPVGSWITLAW